MLVEQNSLKSCQFLSDFVTFTYLEMTEETDRGNDTISGADLLQPPVVRPPRRISKPTIKLKMPPLSPQIAYNTPGGLVTVPITPVTGLSSGYPVNVFQAYPNKAQEFMFKQFAGKSNN